MKKAIKGIFILLLLFFIVVYINKNSNYYDNEAVLTQEAILEFENDLKEGKQINPSYYVRSKKDYNNKACKVGMKCSKIVESVVNYLLKKMLDSIDLSS